TLDKYYINDVFSSFGGGTRTQSQVLGYGASTYLDGAILIAMNSAVSVHSQYISIDNASPLYGWNRPTHSEFRSGTGGTVLDLAIEPGLRSVPYLLEGDNSVWMLNPLSGQSSRLATLNQQPQCLIFGGPKQNLFVLSSGSRVSLDWHGR